MQQSAQPEDLFPSAKAQEGGTDRSSGMGRVGSAGDRSDGSPLLEETELDTALQLLVERAQYITGATGTALALPQGEEMVCRASSGSSAPAIGARLQVRSGLTGESISRRQLLRCDNAEADPRVNLEACRALGIASIVVLPLLRRNGEVRGLFELFSDHPYAFEERDLIALERMADLTLTALDLAEQRRNSAPVPTPRLEPDRAVESPVASRAPLASAVPLDIFRTDTPRVDTPASVPPTPEIAEAAVVAGEPSITLTSSPTASVPATGAVPALAPVPEAMLRVQKCASCGFPVSEGRTLCLDCERKDSEKKKSEEKQREREQRENEQPEREQRKKEQREMMQHGPEQDTSSASEAPFQDEFVPAFLANAAPVSESWLANHVNLLAIVVLIVGILVAVVVFR
ncbi:MAG TPA: GAF domain-containing protein [Terriglobales bacterium]